MLIPTQRVSGGTGRPPQRPRRAPALRQPVRVVALALLLGASTVGPLAVAGPSDAFHVYGSLSYMYDDNLFRLSDDQPGNDNQKSDSSRQSTIGAFFDKTYGRQRVQVQARRSKVTFSHFDQLNYSGKDYMATLNWALANHLDGKLGATYNQGLAPYSDFRSRERNLRVQKREFFDGGWRFHPSARLRAAVARDIYTYELPIQQINNRTETNSEVELDYLPASGSTIGLQARRLAGRYSFPAIFNGVRVLNDFNQDELKVRALWAVTKITNLELLAGYARRANITGGNLGSESGFNGRLTLMMAPRERLFVGGAVWREFSPIESAIVTYALSTGASVYGTWDYSSKIRLEGRMQAERRAYHERAVRLASDELNDRVKRASLIASWKARPTILFSAALSREQRNGSIVLGNGSYTDNTVTVSASAQF